MVEVLKQSPTVMFATTSDRGGKFDLTSESNIPGSEDLNVLESSHIVLLTKYFNCMLVSVLKHQSHNCIKI